MEALRTSDTNQRLWLRLYNNSIWTIDFCSFEVEKEYGEIGMIYDVQIIPPVIYGGKANPETTNKQQISLPAGYSGGDTCSSYYLRSGKSVEFSVPREHLQEPDYFIEIMFRFDWETEYSNGSVPPTTFARFFNSNLPALERYKKIDVEEYWHKEFLRKRDPFD